MTGWPDSELRPIRYAKFFQRPLLPCLPACSPHRRAASLVLLGFFFPQKGAGLKLQLHAQGKRWGLHRAVLRRAGSASASGASRWEPSWRWTGRTQKDALCLLFLRFHHTASRRDGVAEGEDVAGGWAAERGLAGTAGAVQPPPALVVVPGESTTQRDGVQPTALGDTGDPVLFCHRPFMPRVTVVLQCPAPRGHVPVE